MKDLIVEEVYMRGGVSNNIIFILFADPSLLRWDGWKGSP